MKSIKKRNQKKNKSNKKRGGNLYPTCSVIIPCIPNHIKFLDRMITSLSQQTRKPNEIIVAVSELDRNDSNLLEKHLKKIFFKCRVYSTLSKQKSWENRDRGASISKSDYLFFLDADDECHPQRIEVGMDLVKKQNAEFILFGGGDHNTKFEHITSYNYITGDDIYNDEIYKNGDFPISIKHYDVNISFNNGVPLVKTDLWWKHGGQSLIVSEHPQLMRSNGIGEDVIFSRYILDKMEDKSKFMIVDSILLRKYASYLRNEDHWQIKIVPKFINLEKDQKRIIDSCISKYMV